MEWWLLFLVSLQTFCSDNSSLWLFRWWHFTPVHLDIDFHLLSLSTLYQRNLSRILKNAYRVILKQFKVVAFNWRAFTSYSFKVHSGVTSVWAITRPNLSLGYCFEISIDIFVFKDSFQSRQDLTFWASLAQIRATITIKDIAFKLNVRYVEYL